MSIDIQDESTGYDVDLAMLERLARHVLDEMGVHPLVELSIRLVEVDAMTALHEHFMNEPGPTDVLAFPMDELHDQRDDAEDEGDAPLTLLGDAGISLVYRPEHLHLEKARPGSSKGRDQGGLMVGAWMADQICATAYVPLDDKSLRASPGELIAGEGRCRRYEVTVHNIEEVFLP